MKKRESIVHTLANMLINAANQKYRINPNIDITKVITLSVKKAIPVINDNASISLISATKEDIFWPFEPLCLNGRNDLSLFSILPFENSLISLRYERRKSSDLR